MIGFELLRATHHAGRGLFNALAELGSARTAQPRDPLEAAHRLAGALGTSLLSLSMSVPGGYAALENTWEVVVDQAAKVGRDEHVAC